MSPKSNAPKAARYALTIRAGEIVRRGTLIELQTSAVIDPEAVRGLSVAGHRTNVEVVGDGRKLRVDTSALPTGSHTLLVQELWTQRSRSRLADAAVPFILVDTVAPIPEDLAVLHATRLRMHELTTERLAMDDRPGVECIDVFKAEDRKTGRPVTLSYDQSGKRVDLDRELGRLAKRRQAAYGNVHPTLHDALRRARAGPAGPGRGLAARRRGGPGRQAHQAGRPPATGGGEGGGRAAAVGAERFVKGATRHRMEVEAVDEVAPVVYARVPAEAVPALAARKDVATVFLYQPEGIDDLGTSIAIANADDAHAAGTTGARHQRRRLRAGTRRRGRPGHRRAVREQPEHQPALAAHPRDHQERRGERTARPRPGLQPALGEQLRPRGDPLGGRRPRAARSSARASTAPTSRPRPGCRSTTSTRTTWPCTGRTRRSARPPATARTTSSSTTRASTG